MYTENVILPKQITDSFYMTWMHCYEELFNVSLSTKLKLDVGGGGITRKGHELVVIERYERILSNDTSVGIYLKESLTEKDKVDDASNNNTGCKSFKSGDSHTPKPSAMENSAMSSKSSSLFSRTGYSNKLFPGRRKVYRLAEQREKLDIK